MSGKVVNGALVALMVVACIAAAGCRNERAAVGGADTTAAPATDAATATTVTSPAGPAPGDRKPPTVSPNEARYLADALQRGMGHIELAQSVAARSSSVPVDELARAIIEAHNAVNAELTRIAFSESVTLPADAAPELRQTIGRLEGLDGRNLDAAYLAEILQTYPELIRLHDAAAMTATEADVKNVAQRARALFETNLRQARPAYAHVTGTVAPQRPDPSLPPSSTTSSQ